MLAFLAPVTVACYNCVEDFLSSLESPKGVYKEASLHIHGKINYEFYVKVVFKRISRLWLLLECGKGHANDRRQSPDKPGECGQVQLRHCSEMLVG